MWMFIAVPVSGQELLIGYVIKIQDNLVFIDRGSGDGLSIGDQYDVYTTREDKLGQIKVGTVMVTQVFEKVSVAKLLSIVPGETLKMLDTIFFENRPVRKMRIDALPLSERELRPLLVHHAAQMSISGEDLNIFARVSGITPIQSVHVFFHLSGTMGWQRIPLDHQVGDLYVCTIPGSRLEPGMLSYYLTAVDEEDRTGNLGTEDEPIMVDMISETETQDQMLASIENRRVFRKEKSFTPAVLVPGLGQMNRGERTKGFVLLGGSLATLIAGITADNNNGTYFGILSAIYVYHFVDLYWLSPYDTDNRLYPGFRQRDHGQYIFKYSYSF